MGFKERRGVINSLIDGRRVEQVRTVSGTLDVLLPEDGRWEAETIPGG